MLVGIDGSRAFLKQRTGIEEYSYQVIRHLAETRQCLVSTEVVLYIRNNQEIDFSLPKNWTVKKIGWIRLWTQGGLSWEMFRRPVDVLFVPAHTVPLIHPKKTVVTIHGLEYEVIPKAYSWWGRFYMRASIRNSCRWSEKVISVSENTKKDLMRLYQVSEEKIQVVYEGYEKNSKIQSRVLGTNFKSHAYRQTGNPNDESSKPCLVFIGRLEERKNIVGIIKAFEILKERYKIPHKLVLAGRFGYGAEKIKEELKNSNCIKDIVLPGFVSDAEKWELLKKADVFLFPTFYEGFGIPILEAQSVGVPVVTSNVSSMPEVAGESAILVNPMDAEQIADETHKIISDKGLKDDMIGKGYENVKRFSWEKCAREIAKILIK